MHLQDKACSATLGSQPWIATIATLMMSAFEPCMQKLTAARSPKPRVCRFEARSSGTGRRRPSRLVAYPSSEAWAIVRAMNACTFGNRAR